VGSSGYIRRMERESVRATLHLLALRRETLKLPGHRATIAIGSFAAGTADDLSDIDLYVLVDDGAFDDAWNHRDSLRPSDALYWWDIRPDTSREIGTHNWLTRDMVLVECALATPKARPGLSEPYQVLEGDKAAVELFVRRDRISRQELNDFNAHLQAAGHLPEVHARYGEFIRALRAARVKQTPKP
jgi:nucleotidyltransferase-like protein